ncbi:hypothetical protein HDK64DRAFT_249219 [Phyllosticta capitalensis]
MSGNPNNRRNSGHSYMYQDNPNPYGWEEDFPPGYPNNSPPRYFREYPMVTEPTGGSRSRDSSFQDWPFPPPTPRTRAPQTSSYGTTMQPRNSSGSTYQYQAAGTGASGARGGVTTGRSGGMYATSGGPLANSMCSPYSVYQNPYATYGGQQSSRRSSYADEYTSHGYGYDGGYDGGESAARRAYLDALEPPLSPSEGQSAPSRRRRSNRRFVVRVPRLANEC